MTRAELLDVARRIDRARGMPGVSTEDSVRRTAERVDAGEAPEWVEIDPESNLPAGLKDTLTKLLESWENTPPGRGAALMREWRALDALEKGLGREAKA